MPAPMTISTPRTTPGTDRESAVSVPCTRLASARSLRWPTLGDCGCGEWIPHLFGPLPDVLCLSSRNAQVGEAPTRATATGPDRQRIRWRCHAGVLGLPGPRGVTSLPKRGHHRGGVAAALGRVRAGPPRRAAASPGPNHLLEQTGRAFNAGKPPAPAARPAAQLSRSGALKRRVRARFGTPYHFKGFQVLGSSGVFVVPLTDTDTPPVLLTVTAPRPLLPLREKVPSLLTDPETPTEPRSVI